VRDGHVLEGCSYDERECEAIPEGHRFTERGCQFRGGLNVRFGVQSLQLRVDEGCDSEFVAGHRCGYNCGRYVECNFHSVRQYWPQLWVRRRKMKAPRSL
jgi:hypothetical protein